MVGTEPKTWRRTLLSTIHHQHGQGYFLWNIADKRKHQNEQNIQPRIGNERCVFNLDHQYDHWSRVSYFFKRPQWLFSVHLQLNRLAVDDLHPSDHVLENESHLFIQKISSILVKEKQGENVRQNYHWGLSDIIKANIISVNVNANFINPNKWLSHKVHQWTTILKSVTKAGSPSYTGPWWYCYTCLQPLQKWSQ